MAQTWTYIYFYLCYKTFICMQSIGFMAKFTIHKEVFNDKKSVYRKTYLKYYLIKLD